jgi:son of sevenless
MVFSAGPSSKPRRSTILGLAGGEATSHANKVGHCPSHSRLLFTRSRTLVVLREWLEEHNLLQEDPQICPRLREFLLMIKAPPALQLTAKQTLQSLERLYSTPPRDPYEITSRPGGTIPQKIGRKLNKSLGTDVLRIDAHMLATQLTLLEARLYSRVRAAECLAYSRTGGVSNNGVITLKDKSGGGPLGSMQHLVAFCATK